MTNIAVNKKKINFSVLNRVLIVLYLFGGGLLLTFLTIGITEKLFFPLLAVNIALAAVYNLNRKKGIFKVPLIILRCIAIFMTAILLISPIIGLSFNKSKVMYPVKRLVFGYGVRYGDNMDVFLPKKLPKKCNEYRFLTQLIFPAQDYSPHACLLISCDEKYISEYTDNVKKNGFKEVQKNCTFDEFLEEKGLTVEDISGDENLQMKANVLHKYLNLPYHVRWYESLSPDTVVYSLEGAPSGCALDKTSGIMIFWS